LIGLQQDTIRFASFSNEMYCSDGTFFMARYNFNDFK
jgi:hypothetical protein